MSSSFFSKHHASRSSRSLFAVTGMVVLMLALTLALAACGDEGGLVGKWESSSGEIMEFTSDGKVVGDGEMEGIEITYETDGDTLTIKAMGMEFLTAKYSVDGDKLKLEEPETGEIETMTRVK